MKRPIEYIDAYFSQVLTVDERAIFEKRCLQDEDFAAQVATYIAARQAVQGHMNQVRKQRWRNLQPLQSTLNDNVEALTPVRRLTLGKWTAIAAAACLAIIVFIFWPNKHKDLRVASEKYIAQNFQVLGVSMGNTMDSLQHALSWYNQQQYDRSIMIFSGILQRNANEIYALQYRGLSYLMLKNYDAAITDFDRLSTYDDLISNPGYFYKAISLLQRSKPGDVELATKLLKQVVDQQLEGHLAAASFLNDN